MITRTVMKVKDSLVITIPKDLCDLIGIKKGTILKVELKGQRIIFAPVTELSTAIVTDAASHRPIKESAPA